MAHDVFISYSTRDKATADAVCHALEQRAIRCWIAPRDVEAGRSWKRSIVEGIRNARLMVLVFSAEANDSSQVQREVDIAFEAGHPILPFRIEDVEMNPDLYYCIASRHWLVVEADHDGAPDGRVLVSRQPFAQPTQQRWRIDLRTHLEELGVDRVLDDLGIREAPVLGRRSRSATGPFVAIRALPPRFVGQRERRGGTEARMPLQERPPGLPYPRIALEVVHDREAQPSVVDEVGETRHVQGYGLSRGPESEEHVVGDLVLGGGVAAGQSP